MRKLIIFINLIFTISLVKSQDWIQIGQDILPGGALRSSISLSSDGSIVAIGDPYSNSNGEKAGNVRIYQNNSGTWTQIGSNIPGEAAGDEFGSSVSLSSDGAIIAAGASYNDNGGVNSGNVRIFKYISGDWSQIGSSINGIESGEKASSVSLSSDGSIVAIGASGNAGGGTNRGQVRIYQNISNVWTQIGYSINGIADYDGFGRPVSLNAQGNILAASASSGDANGSNSGQVRVFEYIDDMWTQIGQSINGEAAEDFSGSSIDLNPDGIILAVGARYNDGNGSNSGHARVFQYNQGTWEQIGSDIDGVAGSESGSVSLNDDGSVIAVGAWRDDSNGTDAGHVRVYKYNEGTWLQYGNDIDGKAAYDCSGITTSLNSDGTIVAIGVLYNGGETVYSAPCIIENPPVPDVDPLPDVTAECFVTVNNQPTATDDCDNTLYGTTSDPLTYDEIGTYTITWTYEDNQNNTTLQNQSIIITEDVTNPVITCVSNQEVTADETYFYTVNGTEFDPTETFDYCGISSVENDFNNSATLDGAQIPEGITSITWTITDNSGNTNSCSFDITVNAYIGIETLKQNGISIFPNPTNGEINFKFNNNNFQKITISDITGKLIIERKDIQKDEQIDLSSYGSGIYILCIQTDNEILLKKLIKK